MNHLKSGLRLILAVGVFSLAGCATSTGDRFYMLSPDGKLPDSTAIGDLVLGIGPVSIPDYIDRAELVFQSAPNRFEVPPEHRWVGDLEKTFTDVLATNIGHRLNTASVYPYSWDPNIQPRYSIPVHIRQFHAMSGGDAILEASWEVLDGETNELLHHGSKIFTDPLKEEGYDGVVAAESRLIGQLADAIGAMIRQ